MPVPGGSVGQWRGVSGSVVGLGGLGRRAGGRPFWFRDATGVSPAQNGRGETLLFALGMNGDLVEKR